MREEYYRLLEEFSKELGVSKTKTLYLLLRFAKNKKDVFLSESRLALKPPEISVAEYP